LLPTPPSRVLGIRSIGAFVVVDRTQLVQLVWKVLLDRFHRKVLRDELTTRIH